MTKSYESLEELIEDKARKAKAEQIVARSQAQRERDEHSWRCGYDYMLEGGLGDFLGVGVYNKVQTHYC